MRILRKTLTGILLLIFSVPAVAGGDEQKPSDELRRKAMFRAQLAPITKEVRHRHKLDGDSGVLLEKVFLIPPPRMAISRPVT